MHKWLNPNQDAFWAFSWDQFVFYDMPARFEYVRAVTGQEQLVYIGHSEGTMQGFAAFSYNQTLASYVKLFVALAPVAMLGHMTLPFIHLLTSIPEWIVWDVFGHKSFGESGTAFQQIEAWICKFIPQNCQNVLCVLAGCESSNSINQSRMPVILSHFPAGSSVQNVLHYSQGVKAGTFQMYDYGSSGNKQHYGQNTPPQWPLSQFSVKTAFFYGGRDSLADPTDVNALIRQIDPFYVLEIPTYGHGDFTWAVDAWKVVYTPILQLISSL